ncbi:hypothetical protein [Streptomyces platensis]|uniref:hypothetical protein n=1 Tax=Streptomyces platensis TaxID=58346 RepID=UPI00367EE685
MRSTDTPRLLPWSSPDGKPCFLVGDGTGYVSRLADEMEEAQLDAAAELGEEAHRILAGRAWTPGEIHLLALELATSLADVRRIAESRGARLPVPQGDDGLSLNRPGANRPGANRPGVSLVTGPCHEPDR